MVLKYEGGHGGLQYCSIELFFKPYFGNFDFNVRYCSIIQLCGTRFFILLANGIRYHGIAILFIWNLLSNVGQYLEDFRLNGK